MKLVFYHYLKFVFPDAFITVILEASILRQRYYRTIVQKSIVKYHVSEFRYYHKYLRDNLGLNKKKKK